MLITDYRNDPRFKNSEQAFLVTGTSENDSFNRKLLNSRQTGYWIVRPGRIYVGDVIFILLPNPNNRTGYPRELYAGVITQQKRRNEDNRVLFIVNQFYVLDSIEAGVKAFLGDHVPPAGNRVQTVWG